MRRGAKRSVHSTRTHLRLTDLEGAALGLIRASGGLTAYAIRSRFRASPSTLYSESSGTVYPMVARLERDGLLSARDAGQGRRAATLYVCTAAGTRAWRRWLEVPDARLLVTWDPLRTRALYLGLLPANERAAWLAQAARALREHAARIRALERAEPADRVWERLAHRNALLQAEARLRWIRQVQGALARGLE